MVDFLLDAHKLNPSLIEDSHVLRSLLDLEYGTAFKFFCCKFVVYICFYFLLNLIVFTNNDLSTKYRQNLELGSLFTSILFFSYEVVQLMTEGMNYFLDAWNVFDILGYISFWMIYFRFFSQPEQKSMEILLKVVVILNMLVKINFFLRIFNKFG